MVLFGGLSGVSHARDWADHNEALVRRDEILLDVSLLRGWSGELVGMNRGKEDGRYRHSGSLIKLSVFIHAYLRRPYRQLEGFIIYYERMKAFHISE